MVPFILGGMVLCRGNNELIITLIFLYCWMKPFEINAKDPVHPGVILLQEIVSQKMITARMS